MATVVEALDSSNLSGQPGEQRSTRRFFVYGTDVTHELDVHNLFGTATTPDALPNYWHQHPRFTNLFARTPRIRRTDGFVDQWEVEWEYQGIFIVPGGPQGEPGEIGYVEFNVLTTRQLSDTLRTRLYPGATAEFGELIVSPNGDPAPAQEIQGEPIDSAGHPMSAQRLKIVLAITEVVSGPINWAADRDAAGKRNSSFFYGAPIGGVYLSDIRTTRIAINKFNRDWSFAFDEFFHMEQQPLRDRTGDVMLVDSPVWGGGSVAKRVRWVQPFPNKYDFNTLSANF